MRINIMAVAGIVFMAAATLLESSGGASAQIETGNRANGLDYQPTPNEVRPREKAEGIQPPVAQQKADGRMLERMDKNLLREEGQSTKSVPNLTTDH